MGKLTDDMIRMIGEIESLRDSRKVFRLQLDKETRERKTEVSTIRAELRDDQNNMALQTKADRVKFVSSLEAEVSGFLKAFDKAHAATAADTKKAIVGFVLDVADHVSGLLTGYRKDQKARGAATKRENALFVTDVTRFVNAKKKETKVMIDGFKAEHDKMAKVTKAERKEFVNKLKNMVGVMRKVNVDDLAGARAVWAGIPIGAKARLMAEQRAAEQEKKLRLEAEQKAKGLEGAKAAAERSKAQAQSSVDAKTHKK